MGEIPPSTQKVQKLGAEFGCSFIAHAGPLAGEDERWQLSEWALNRGIYAIALTRIRSCA
jgi:hypothetical protein